MIFDIDLTFMSLTLNAIATYDLRPGIYLGQARSIITWLELISGGKPIWELAVTRENERVR